MRAFVLAAVLVMAGCCNCRDEEKEPAGPPIEIGAQALYDAYEANEVAADEKYKGKLLLVAGKVGGVSKDFMDDVVIHLDVESKALGDIMAGMAGSEKAKAAALSKGERVALRCSGAGRIMDSPSLRGCRIE